jgi:hypothetical protein
VIRAYLTAEPRYDENAELITEFFSSVQGPALGEFENRQHQTLEAAIEWSQERANVVFVLVDGEWVDARERLPTEGALVAAVAAEYTATFGPPAPVGTEVEWDMRSDVLTNLADVRTAMRAIRAALSSAARVSDASARIDSGRVTVRCKVRAPVARDPLAWDRHASELLTATMQRALEEAGDDGATLFPAYQPTQ